MTYDEFEMPQSLDTGNFLNADGWFHVLVTKVETQPTKEDGSPINAKKFGFRVLAGTEPSQKGALHNEFINNPSMSHKDGGEFARKTNARAAIAMNCLQPGAQGKVQVDWNRALGQTLVVKVAKNKNDDYLGVDGAHYYHVNDPAVAEIPKDMSVVQAAPQQQQPPQQAPPQQAPPQQQSMLPNGYQAPAGAPPQQYVPSQQQQPAYPPPQPQHNGHQQPVGINDL